MWVRHHSNTKKKKLRKYFALVSVLTQHLQANTESSTNYHMRDARSMSVMRNVKMKHTVAHGWNIQQYLHNTTWRQNIQLRVGTTVFISKVRCHSRACTLLQQVRETNRVTGTANDQRHDILTFYTLPVTWCTNSLTFNNCTFCPHCIYVFCIYLKTNSDLCHLQHKLIGFITDMKSVYCAVRTGSFNKAVRASYLTF